MTGRPLQQTSDSDVSKLDPGFVGEIAGSFNDRRLQLFILPTEKCNFRCTYCYEKFDIGRMKPATVKAVKAFIDRRIHQLDVLSVEWFGGEPLLAKPVIIDVAQHIHSSLASNSPVMYSGSMTTNGYLLDGDTATTLIRLGVRSFQISLDGPPDVHDESRVRADGSGSFSEIWRNLLTLRRSDLSFEVMLRLHFTPATAARLYSLIDLINDAFAEDSRFKVVFKAVTRLGGENDHKLELFHPQAERDAIASFQQHLRHKSQLITHGRYEPKICYAAKPNSFVIRADGRLGKCTVALYDDRNTVGHITEDGRIAIDNDKLRPWMNGFETLSLKELGCPVRAL
ncbi:radical SAM protein [Streptomyces sp. NRRL S-813]|uniref:radical SAM protein n=1 Tax=Streptomyces sp. NRRL S-813 TaxID=1463919 RepID=UPI00099DA169|nr:radical SAM protein [Streptomyces sp. NRRL S-813]